MSEQPPPAAEPKKVFNRTWYKVYSTDVFADIRIALLDDSQFRAWIELLAVANDNLTPGFIHVEVPAIARMLRKPEQLVIEYLGVFEEIKLIRIVDGVIEIVGRERFYAGAGLTFSDSPTGKSERKRAQRARARSAHEGHGDRKEKAEGRKKSPSRGTSEFLQSISEGPPLDM